MPDFRPALWALDDDRFRLGASDAKEPTVGKQPCSDLCYLLQAEEIPDSELVGLFPEQCSITAEPSASCRAGCFLVSVRQS